MAYSSQFGRAALFCARFLVTSAFFAMVAAPSWSATITWDGSAGALPPSGFFNVAGNWDTNTVPSAGDEVDFNLASAYIITLAQNEAFDRIFQSAGTLNLLSDNATVRTVDLTTGRADVIVRDGGALNIGLPTNPVFVIVGDQMPIGTSTGDGTVVVRGADSRLDALGTGSQSIGSSGFIGRLTTTEGATANYGTNGFLQIGISGNAATRGTVNVLSDSTFNTGHINIATVGSGATGFILVDGPGSLMEQILVGANLTVGSATIGEGMIDVESGGTFTTGTGTTTINATGTVNVGMFGDGTFNAQGPVNIDGGELNVGPDSNDVFNLGSGQTLTASNDGQVNFNGDYEINNGTTFEFNSDAGFTIDGAFAVGFTGGDGTLIVDGNNSGGATFGTHFWGGNGNTASVTFRNQSTGDLGNIALASSDVAGTTGILKLQTGGLITTRDLTIAALGGSTTTGTVIVDGSGSRFTHIGANTIIVGHASTGTATIDVLVDGTFTTGIGATTLINTTGTVNVGVLGGTYNANGPVIVDGGTLNVDDAAGAFFNLANTETLTASNGGQINFDGNYAIGDATTFEINSGADFSANSLGVGVGNSLGTLIVDGDGSTATATGDSSTWASSGVANVTFRNQARGDFGAINMANVSNSGTTASLSVQSGSTLNTGDIIIAENVNATGATGTITVHGVGSALTVSGPATLTVGSASGTGTATIHVVNSGTFTTGTGTTTINATGTVNVGTAGDGTFNANGPVVVDGGTFNFAPPLFGGGGAGIGLFNLASGHTLTASNNAQVKFVDYDLDDGTTFEINSGADLTAFTLRIGSAGGNGTLVVDGVGSSVSSPLSPLALIGDNGSVTFRNQATGFLDTVTLAQGSFDSTFGNLSVESGATITTGNLFLASAGGAASTAMILIDGGGSELKLNGASTLTVGHASEGSATIDIVNGSNLETGTGTTTINATGTVNVGKSNGGSFVANGPVIVDGGRLDVGDAAFDLTTSQTLTAMAGSQIILLDDYDIDSGTTLDINSGSTLTARILDVGKSGGNGTLIVDGNGSKVTATNGIAEWGVGNIADVTFRNQAAGDLGAISIADSSAVGTLGIFNIESGATVSTGSLLLATNGGANVKAFVTIDGAGSVLSLKGPASLTLGHASEGAATIDIENGGTLNTGTATVNPTGKINLFDGTLNATKIDRTNGGTFNFAGGRLSVAQFDGDLTNVGGTLAPGQSAGRTLVVGDYTQQTGAALEIEIGGLSAGNQHDLVTITGNASLDGDLELLVIDGFVPDPADTFTVFLAANLLGLFDNVTNGVRLGTVDGSGSFIVHYGIGSAFNDNQIVLSDFLFSALLGDYNGNGIVDAADYTVWLDALGGTTLLNDPTPGTVDASDYAFWKANFGAMSLGNGVGSGSGGTGDANIPEPAAWVMLLIGLLAILKKRISKQCVSRAKVCNAYGVSAWKTNATQGALRDPGLWD